MIALAHTCRELLPIINMVTSHGDAVSHQKDMSTMQISIHEENAGALILLKTLPPQ